MRLTPGMTPCLRTPTLMFGGTCGRTRSVVTLPLSESAFASASSWVALEAAGKSVAIGSPPEEESGSSGIRTIAGEEDAEKPSVGLGK